MRAQLGLVGLMGLGVLLSGCGASLGSAPLDQWVVFSERTNVGDGDLFALNTGTRERIPLVVGSEDDLEPRLSPDEQTVMFSRRQTDGTYRVFSVARAGGSVTEVFRDGRVLCWSPDGRRIAVAVEGPPRLLTMNPDGTNVVTAWRAPIGVTDVLSASWRVNVPEFAVGLRDGDGFRVATVWSNGSFYTVLTPATVDAQNPVWSRTGFDILYSQSVQVSIGGGLGSDIFRVPAGGGDPEFRLSRNFYDSALTVDERGEVYTLSGLGLGRLEVYREFSGSPTVNSANGITGLSFAGR